MFKWFYCFFGFFVACVSPAVKSEYASSHPPSADTSSRYQWRKITDSAEWDKSYNYQMFTIQDKLWVFHPDACWFSSDGILFQKSDLSNVINNQAFLDYVPTDKGILGLGVLNGNIETYQFKPYIFKTQDFKNWDTISKSSNIPVRFFYHPFTFQNKIWIIGGEDKTRKYEDIWNSEDGIHWSLIKEKNPFGPRSGSQIVILRDSLYLLNNDVWVSADGLNWTLITEHIIQDEELFGYKALTFENQIWLLACNRNGRFSSQVLCSSDGKTWKTSDAPWLPRGGIAATVFQNKIYITGGKYGGTPNHPEFRYDNDLWLMEKIENDLK